MNKYFIDESEILDAIYAAHESGIDQIVRFYSDGTCDNYPTTSYSCPTDRSDYVDTYISGSYYCVPKSEINDDDLIDDARGIVIQLEQEISRKRESTLNNLLFARAMRKTKP